MKIWPCRLQLRTSHQLFWPVFWLGSQGCTGHFPVGTCRLQSSESSVYVALCDAPRILEEEVMIWHWACSVLTECPERREKCSKAGNSFHQFPFRCTVPLVPLKQWTDIRLGERVTETIEVFPAVDLFCALGGQGLSHVKPKPPKSQARVPVLLDLLFHWY